MINNKQSLFCNPKGVLTSLTVHFPGISLKYSTKFLIELFCWATFTIIYRPDINNFIHTNLINAGVVWSLSYEWLFYASLPILSILLLKKKTSTIYVTLSVLFVFIYFIVHNINYNHLLSFFGVFIT